MKLIVHMTEKPQHPPNDPEPDKATQARTFSRASIFMSSDLVKPFNPQLAMQIRNIAGKPPLFEEKDNLHSQHFKVELNSFEVRQVVEAIVENMEKVIDQEGAKVMAQAILEDWLKLADQMVQEEGAYPRS